MNGPSHVEVEYTSEIRTVRQVSKPISRCHAIVLGPSPRKQSLSLIFPQTSLNGLFSSESPTLAHGVDLIGNSIGRPVVAVASRHQVHPQLM